LYQGALLFLSHALGEYLAIIGDFKCTFLLSLGILFSFIQLPSLMIYSFFPLKEVRLIFFFFLLSTTTIFSFVFSAFLSFFSFSKALFYQFDFSLFQSDFEDFLIAF
jgi:hypothetical protein